MAGIVDMTVEEYKKRICHNEPCLVHPKIPNATNFKLKGNILVMLKDIPFNRKDHEDAYKRIEQVNVIVNYFNVPNIT